MRYVVGVLTVENDGITTAVALTWFNSPPPFSVHGMTLEFMRKNLLALIRTNHSDPEKAINAALQRTAEKLYLKEFSLNPVNGDPAFSIILQPRNSKYNILFPFNVQKKHWLLNGAKRAYDAWTERCDV